MGIEWSECVLSGWIRGIKYAAKAAEYDEAGLAKRNALGKNSNHTSEVHTTHYALTYTHTLGILGRMKLTVLRTTPLSYLPLLLPRGTPHDGGRASLLVTILAYTRYTVRSKRAGPKVGEQWEKVGNWTQ
eukprot:8155299-Pyramimonas_sp.AAC.2